MKTRIRERREELGISQEELAKRVGCSRQYVVAIESDKETNVSSKLLLAIARVLGTTTDYLLFNDNV